MTWRVRNFRSLHELFHVYVDEENILRVDHKISFRPAQINAAAPIAGESDFHARIRFVRNSGNRMQAGINDFASGFETPHPASVHQTSGRRLAELHDLAGHAFGSFER